MHELTRKWRETRGNKIAVQASLHSYARALSRQGVTIRGTGATDPFRERCKHGTKMIKNVERRSATYGALLCRLPRLVFSIRRRHFFALERHPRFRTLGNVDAKRRRKLSCRHCPLFLRVARTQTPSLVDAQLRPTRSDQIFTLFRRHAERHA